MLLRSPKHNTDSVSMCAQCPPLALMHARRRVRAPVPLSDCCINNVCGWS